MPGPIRFWGTVRAVRPRLVLSKFEGETAAKCPGYIATLEGTTTAGADAPAPGVFTVAVGPATMQERQIRVGDLLRGDAHPVPDSTPDVPAEYYRVGVLRTIARAQTPPAPDPPRTDPPLTPEAVERAARRPLAPPHLGPSGPCGRCPYGLVVCTVLLQDPRDRRGEWHRVPACLGPADCPHYRRP